MNENNELQKPQFNSNNEEEKENVIENENQEKSNNSNEENKEESKEEEKEKENKTDEEEKKDKNWHLSHSIRNISKKFNYIFSINLEEFSTRKLIYIPIMKIIFLNSTL